MARWRGNERRDGQDKSKSGNKGGGKQGVCELSTVGCYVANPRSTPSTDVTLGEPQAETKLT